MVIVSVIHTVPQGAYSFLVFSDLGFAVSPLLRTGSVLLVTLLLAGTNYLTKASEGRGPVEFGLQHLRDCSRGGSKNSPQLATVRLQSGREPDDD